MNKKTVAGFIENGFLVGPELIGRDDDAKQILDGVNLKTNGSEKPVVLGSELLSVFDKGKDVDINWLEFDSSKALYEKGKNGKPYENFLNILNQRQEFKQEIEQPAIEGRVFNGEYKVIVLKSYDEPAKKRSLQDFVTYFRLRYDGLRKILINRPELQNATSITRIMQRGGNEPVALIGIVASKKVTKNGSIIMNIEDLTGSMPVIVTKTSNGLHRDAMDVVEDEVIGVTGFVRDRAVFARSILWPDVPVKELKKASEDVYMAVISDIHVGSKKFLFDEFMRFVEWINCETKDEKQNEMARKVKYLFVVGDIIDGCGVFPGQEELLAIKDMGKQYDACAAILSQVRKDIKIIICPGQHDSLRSSEPQPTLYRDFAKRLWELENVIMVSNPAYVNVHSSKDFPGFDVLMYHGASFHYYMANVDSIRQQDPKRNPSVVSRFLLKRRHLAPTYGSVGILPDTKQDAMIIDRVPDFFINGDMHRTNISNYNGVTIINSSCWQDKTEFEEKIGNDPDPAKVVIVNLKTREIKIKNFSL